MDKNHNWGTLWCVLIMWLKSRSANKILDQSSSGKTPLEKSKRRWKNIDITINKEKVRKWTSLSWLKTRYFWFYTREFLLPIMRGWQQQRRCQLLSLLVTASLICNLWDKEFRKRTVPLNCLHS
jgi:hypothetical protein